jgi:PKD repeat protein
VQRAVQRAFLSTILLFLVACGGPTPQTLSVNLNADKQEGTAPLAVNFSAEVPGGGGEVGYSWDFGTGDTAQGSASRPYVFTEAGTYDVTVEASVADRRASDTLTVTVREAPATPDNRPPAVELGASATAGQAPLTVNFSANAVDPDADPLLYSWNFGDGTTVAASGTPNQAHTFTQTGSYAVVVTVDDGEGGLAQAELQIAVANPDEIDVPPTDPPAGPDGNEPPTVELSASTTRGTAPLTVSFSADASDPDGDPLAYSWTFGNGERAEGNSSQTIVYDEPGEYTTVVTVSDGLSERRASVRVQVDPPAEPPVANTPPSVSVSATPLTGSVPLRVTLEAEASDADGDDLSYLWDFGDGTISGDNPAVHVYGEAGTYTAAVTVSDRQGGKTRQEVTITVTGEGDPVQPDVPYYGEWAWAARGEGGRTFVGYLSISQRTPEPKPEFADNYVEGGMGVWTYCRNGVDACGAPTGLGYIDVVDYGQGHQYDIIFVDGATGLTTMVAFDEDDRLGNEVDGAPTFQGGGAWIYENGGSENLSFAIVKIGSEPQRAMDAALSTLSAQRHRSH